MKSKVKLLLDFAKGESPTNERMRIYSVIDGEKKLMDEFSTDAPVSVNLSTSYYFLQTYSTLILILFPQWGQLMVMLLLLNNSDISTPNTFAILLNVS